MQTEFVMFSRRDNFLDFDTTSNRSGAALYLSNCTKYFGIILDNKPNWNKNIAVSIQKMYPSCTALQSERICTPWFNDQF